MANNNRLMGTLFIFLAIGGGCIVNILGDWLLGVRLEFFFGVYTFSPWWVLDLFVVPFIAGFVVSMIYGLGGKILCYFAPLIVRLLSYYDAAFGTGVPDGMSLLPVWYWILIVIVAIESAAFGGAFGEVLFKRTYGRRSRELYYKKKVSDS